jgi:hypothetical protein
MSIATAPSPLLGTGPRLPFGSSYLHISQDMGFKPQKNLAWMVYEDPPEELPWDAAWPGNHTRGETSSLVPLHQEVLSAHRQGYHVVAIHTHCCQVYNYDNKNQHHDSLSDLAMC